MNRVITLLASCALTPALLAATGGPDAYGYIWKDSNEPGGPAFNWIDITSYGQQITGLADDNIVGPFFMQTNHPYYWYDVKKVWIGSNGYIAFNSVNIASPFPTIPAAFPPNDYIAGMTCDLNFSGAGNPAQMWYYDNADTTVFTWLNVPFWTNVAPNWTGSNTFQIILNKADSSITVQFLQQTGLPFQIDVLSGIESVAGDIGLQHSADVLPPINYAIRYYMPGTPLLDVTDASLEWNTDPTTGGRSLKRFGPPFPLTVNAKNTGNQPIGNFTVTGQVLNAIGTIVATDQVTVGYLDPAFDTTITFGVAFNPNVAGTYRFRGTITGITGELISSNNLREQELVVYDTSLSTINVRWSGPMDNGVGIGWDGGNGGVGTYVMPPNYPAYISAYVLRLSANSTPSGCYLKLFDDNGPDGGPGTLLDSIYVPPAQATVGDLTIPLGSPFTLNDGGVFVQWYMAGPFINIAIDPQAPFSLLTYEIIDNVWAEYRTRTTQDFHLGIQITQPPVLNTGCTGFFGVINGSNVTGPITVRTWVRNFGNQPISGIPLRYAYNGGPVVQQNYTGTPINPGDSILFTFGSQFNPDAAGTGDLCAWTDLPGDVNNLNDTACVSLVVTVGLAEHRSQELRLMPNPAQDEVVLQGLAPGAWQITVVDLGGAVVLNRDLALPGGPLRLDVHTLAQGTYQLQARSGRQVSMAKLIIVR